MILSTPSKPAPLPKFKPIFLGTVEPNSPMGRLRRVVNSQKCVRAGGKHNDLTDVGRDSRHHTFFEMLGNWSFGDYFKAEACSMAWEFLTQELGLPKDRLYISYFGGDQQLELQPDAQTRDVWLQLGIPPSHLLPFGAKENFWEMGDVGPCGPCSEIHYDHVGARDASALVNADDRDVVEIWNLVFMQYSRELDSSLHPLPSHGVDCGMGLERLVAVMQGSRSTYDTDLFQPLLRAIEQEAMVRPYEGRENEDDAYRIDMAYRVVADHVRALTVCIADGVYPGMTGRELVLRQILRRAVRFAHEILHGPSGMLARLVPAVCENLGDVYPELVQEKEQVMEVIDSNEAAFLGSLAKGRRLIDRTVRALPPDAAFPAHVALSLQRGLGFPQDLVSLMLEEHGRHLEAVDTPPEGIAWKEEGSKENVSQPLNMHVLAELRRRAIPATTDDHKYACQRDGPASYRMDLYEAQVLALHKQDELVETVDVGKVCDVILDQTNFYANQGGQSGDKGLLLSSNQEVLAEVQDVKLCGGYVVHTVCTQQPLHTGVTLCLSVDMEWRFSCSIHHTATHLLSAALCSVIGPTSRQMGSLVAPQHLRFDVSIRRTLTGDQLQQLERVVCKTIQQNHMVHVRELPLEEALRLPRIQSLDMAYPDKVRVVGVGLPEAFLMSSGPLEDVAERGKNATPDDSSCVSLELCCGTHVHQTGDIGDFCIVWERQLGKGVSRLQAVTGRKAQEARERGATLSDEVSSLRSRLAIPADTLNAALNLARDAGQLQRAVDQSEMPQWQRRDLQVQLKSLQRHANTVTHKLEHVLASKKAQDLLHHHIDSSVLVGAVDAENISVLVKTARKSCENVRKPALLFSTQRSGKVLLACYVPQESTEQLSALAWLSAVCEQMDGKASGTAVSARGILPTGVGDVFATALTYPGLQLLQSKVSK
uniref:alanine--tRNA ligase, mitochondrial-like isoform X2 n=1 Tax=Myxine glutinosa TaxID=7769 RepID=UPI00358FBFE6